MRITVFVFLVMLVASGSIGAGDQAPQGPAAPDDARFEFLKRLEGTWTGSSGHEGMTEGVFEFRVTAGGHAIEEREMVGTPMEMLTVYHMQGKELVATHYCMLGNQPRVTAEKKIVNDTLRFACNGKPGNARSHDDEHVHGWSMRIDDQGRLHYSGKLMKQGQLTETPEFVLTRQSDAARR